MEGCEEGVYEWAGEVEGRVWGCVYVKGGFG